MNPTAATNSDLTQKYNLYGWGPFRCGGILSRPLFAYVMLCICTFVQNFTVNGANNAVISTLERAFYLDSVQSGFFLALYDLATVVSSPVVGYLGGLYSSPIFFSLNMIIVAIGNIMVASSNFVNQGMKINLNSQLIQNSFTTDNVLFQCYKNPFNNQSVTDTTCLKVEQLSKSVTNAKALLYIGNCVTGIGSVALLTIGIAYIERIFPREKAAYCQAIYFAVGTVGGALGIVVTGRFLLLYTNLTSGQYLPAWLKPTHPLWIGCWWLPYLIYGSLCFLIGIFVSGLPNFEIPGQKYLIQETTSSSELKNHTSTNREDSSTETTTTTTVAITPNTPGRNTDGVINHAYSSDTLYNQVITSPSTTASNPPVQHRGRWKDMCAIICELLQNVRFIFIVIANLFEGILLKGFVPFITKYFEYQHQLDSSTATLITGAIALLSVVIGCPIGAFCMNRYSWTPKRCASVCMVILTLSSFLFLLLTLSCPELKFQYTDCSNENSPCCHNIYRPVCDIENRQKMYLSPCHFGCTNQTLSSVDSTTLYSSCNCADNTVLSETACRFRRIPCTAIFVLAILGATCVVFFTAFIQVPLLQVLFHTVPLPYQNMALALRQTTVRVLGQTTGPLIFGFAFDRSCLVWLTDCYGRRTCKVYNNRRMGLSMALSGFLTRFISGTSCGVVYFIWKFKYSEDVAPNTLTTPTTDVPAHTNENNELTRL
ncbi:unnamed protein product [Adineta ricciae]|uniref:Kazal-like domain-containing protein n=1 Tax=Adineta ricciae TaxID=249248 RepID=A0A813ZJB6_ADIRI|nr:unnamed protein product [Adineta ricciae]